MEYAPFYEMFCVVLLLISLSNGELWHESEWTIMKSHYPCYLKVSNVVLNASKIFFYNSEFNEHSSLHGTGIWPLQNVQETVCRYLMIVLF